MSISFRDAASRKGGCVRSLRTAVAASFAALLAILSAEGVLADERRFYLGASGGVTYAGGQEDFLEEQCARSTVLPCAAKPTPHGKGFKVFGGFEFNDHFGVEIGYADLGKAKAENVLGPRPAVGVTGPIVITNDLRTHVYFASAVARIEAYDRTSLFVKAGAQRWAQSKTVTAIVTQTSGVTVTRQEASEVDLLLGAGARYAMNDRISLQIEWERYLDTGNSKSASTIGSDLDFFSAGVLVRF